MSGIFFSQERSPLVTWELERVGGVVRVGRVVGKGQHMIDIDRQIGEVESPVKARPFLEGPLIFHPRQRLDPERLLDRTHLVFEYTIVFVSIGFLFGNVVKNRFAIGKAAATCVQENPGISVFRLNHRIRLAAFLFGNVVKNRICEWESRGDLCSGKPRDFGISIKPPYSSRRVFVRIFIGGFNGHPGKKLEKTYN